MANSTVWGYTTSSIRAWLGNTGQPSQLINQGALNHKSKDFARRNQFLLDLLSPHLNQAYRNAQTFTHMQQKLTLVDRALDRLHLGIIVLTTDRKVRLATESAVKQLTNYLGPGFSARKPSAGIAPEVD